MRKNTQSAGSSQFLNKAPEQVSRKEGYQKTQQEQEKFNPGRPGGPPSNGGNE